MIRTTVDDLKSLDLGGDTKQKQVFRFYAPRAVQLGEAALLVFDMVTPLAVIARVLCEDAIIAHFAALSEENAAECLDRADKVQRRFVRALILSGNSRLEKTVEHETLSILEDQNLRTDSLEEIAKKSGVKMLYDRHYRLGSGELHGSYLDAGPDFEYSLIFARGTAAIALALTLAAIKHPTESGEVARQIREPVRGVRRQDPQLPTNHGGMELHRAPVPPASGNPRRYVEIPVGAARELNRFL